MVFAYTAALNRLLSDKEHVQYAGDTTVVYWAETAQAECQDIFGCLMDNHFERFSEQEFSRCVSELLKGVPYNLNGVEISPDTRFYVLGLTPNAARLSVRFFYRNTFGKLLENIEKHYERLKLVKPAYEPFERLSIGNLLYAAVNPNARGKSASPLLSGRFTAQSKQFGLSAGFFECRTFAYPVGTKNYMGQGLRHQGMPAQKLEKHQIRT